MIDEYVQLQELVCFTHTPQFLRRKLVSQRSVYFTNENEGEMREKKILPDSFV